MGGKLPGDYMGANEKHLHAANGRVNMLWASQDAQAILDALPDASPSSGAQAAAPGAQAAEAPPPQIADV